MKKIFFTLLIISLFIFTFCNTSPMSYNLNITSENGSVSLQINGKAVTGSSPFEVPNEAAVVIEAIPDNGYSFDSWQGDLTGNTNPENFSMESDMSITALFIELLPEISVRQGTSDIPSGTQGYDFGDILIGSSSSPITFTIENTGDADLEITDVSIDDSVNFTLTDDTSSPISPTGTTSFDVTFNPSAIDSYNATITITNNDTDESDYTFNVIGNGYGNPEINITDGTNDIPSGSMGVDFGDVDEGSTSFVQTFTIENTGDADLEITDVSIDDSVNFTLTDNTSSPISPTGTTSFDVTFNPIDSGLQSATITITNNDPDEGSYTVMVQGTGLQIWNQVDSFTGHSNGISCVDFNSDDSLIASASWDNTIKIWEYDTGTSSWVDIHTLTGHTSMVLYVEFSPDDSMLVSGSSDHTVKVWEYDSGSSTWTDAHTLTGHTEPVNTTRFSFDGTKIVSASSDSFIRLWEYDSGTSSWTNPHTIFAHTSSVNSAEFNSDATKIVTSSYDDTVKIWEWDSGTSSWILSDTFTKPGYNYFSGIFNSDSTKVLFGSSDHNIYEESWDGSSWTESTITGHTDLVYVLDITSDDSLLASGSYDNDVRLWSYDGSTWQIDTVLQGHTTSILSVRFNSDDTKLVSCDLHQNIIIWEW